MTSEPTRLATETFFKDNKYFGIRKENVEFFNQGVLPAFKMDDGKIFLEDGVSPFTVFLNTNFIIFF